MKYLRLLGISVVSLLLFSGCDKEEVVPEPQLPISEFIYSGDKDINGKLESIPVTILFESISEFTDSVEWDFGDGEKSTAENPEHTYTENGVYTVSLVAMNNDGSDTSSVEIQIGVAASDMSISTTSQGVTVFSIEYALGTTDTEGTATYFVEISTYSDFSQMIEFSDEGSQNLVVEKELSGTGTYQFRDLKPGTWYYYRIRQEVSLNSHTYGPFYSDTKTAKLGALPAPGLTIATYTDNACVLKVMASINEPPGESLYLTGSDVVIEASYSQNFSTKFTMDSFTSGSATQGESFYYRKPGSTIFLRGWYEYKGRMAFSNVLPYVTDNYVANLSSKTYSGTTATINVGTNMVLIGSQSGEHIRFLVQDYAPNTLDTYSIIHSSFEYEDENETDFIVVNTNEFHEKVVLKVLEETDTYVICQLVNQDDMSTELYYSLSTGSSTESIFLSGLIFKAEKVQ